MALTAILLSSCGMFKKKNEFTYWINSSKVDCVGVGPRKCLQVYKGDNLEDCKWQSFFAKIEGFDFEKGYIYKLKVKEEELKKESLPADASSIKYSLVEMLEKIEDKRLHIEGDWLLAGINGGPVNRSVVLPVLKISVKDMRISGFGGCNNYMSQITSLTQNCIKLGNIVATRKAGMKRNIEEPYLKALGEILTYKVDGDKLHFYGDNESKLLSFIKMKDDADKRLNDIWALQSIMGEKIKKSGKQQPVLEIKLADMEVMGSNGCNNFKGKITKIGREDIELGALATTRKMCIDMTLPDKFDKAMKEVKMYKLNGLNLILLNASGKELMSFKKVD